MGRKYTAAKYKGLNGLALTANQWAERIGIQPESVRSRARNGIPVDLDRLISKPKYTDPKTSREMTAERWAIYLGIEEKAFKNRIKKWGTNDPRTFLPPSYSAGGRINEFLHETAKRKGTKLCHNSDTGESKLAWEWAKYYRVSLSEFYRAMKRFGKDDCRLYRHFEAKI